MFEPLSIHDAAAQIRGGQLQPLELVDQCLEQIDRYDDRLHAWVVVDAAGARRTARQLGRQEPRGPLHGIPLGIKAQRRESSVGVLISMLLVLAFYLFILVAESLSKRPGEKWPT